MEFELHAAKETYLLDMGSEHNQKITARRAALMKASGTVTVTSKSDELLAAWTQHLIAWWTSWGCFSAEPVEDNTRSATSLM